MLMKDAKLAVSTPDAGVRAGTGSSAGGCRHLLHPGCSGTTEVTGPCKPVQRRENQNLACLPIPRKGVPGADTQKRGGMRCILGF